MNKVLLIISMLLLTCGYTSVAQEKILSINVDYHPTLAHQNPLLHLSNPAAISYNDLDSIMKFSIGYTHINGNFKPTMSALKTNQINLHTESYKKINKTMLYGKFDYTKTGEEETPFSNLYETYRGTPYLFVDTLNKSNYDKEQYQISAKIAHQYNQYFTLAGAVDYNVGLGAQNRDPRALNKVSELSTRIGAIGNTKMLKIGADIYYHYRNEDVDVNVIEENTMHPIFSLSGLGSYSKHNASHFYRLYKQQQYGYNFFLELANNLFSVGFNKFEETAMDGRKEGEAVWSATKTDTKYRGQDIALTDVFTKRINNSYHQLIVKANQNKSVGTEVLQLLEIANVEYDIYQWQTLKEEDKYFKNDVSTSLEYTYSKYKSTYLRDFSLGAKIAYFTQKKEYNFQDLFINYSTLNYNISTSKLFTHQQHSIDTKLELVYHHTHDLDYDLAFNTFITDKIIKPDIDYFTSDFYTGGITLNYAYTTDKSQNYFIIVKHHLQHTTNERFKHPNRHYLKMALGLIF